MREKERWQYQFNKMSEQKRYNLLKQIEEGNKNLGESSKADPKFIESILNVMLEATTAIAMLFGIVNKKN